MSSSVKLSSTSKAQMQTTKREEAASRTSHVSCSQRQGDPLSHRPFDTARFADVSDDRARDRSERRAGRALSLPRVSVGDLMTRNVVCVRPELCLTNVVGVFRESGLEALPVVDASGRLLGFVSASVVLQEIRTATCERGQTACDLMTPCALAVPESACITQAAALMAFEGQTRVAVTGRTGTVVGVLSAGDVLYWLARADGHVPARSPHR